MMKNCKKLYNIMQQINIKRKNKEIYNKLSKAEHSIILPCFFSVNVSCQINIEPSSSEHTGYPSRVR